MASNLKDIIKEEYVKCASDPGYFIRKYVMIQHPKRGKVNFIMYDFQENVLKEFRKHSRNIILKNRQMGISTLSAAYALWLMTFRPDSFVLVIATKQDVAKNIISKVRFSHYQLPSWLKQACVEDNKLGQTYKNGSWIKAITTSADDSGRGEGVTLLIIDEAAFIQEMDKLWAALQPTLSTGGDIIVLSTPNGIGNWFHKTYQNADEKKNTFNPIVLHWSMHPERDEKWRQEQDVELGPRLASQECDGSFITSGNTVVSSEILLYYRETYQQEPIEETGIDKNIWIWEYPEVGRSYLISADTGRGDSDDFSSFNIIDIETLVQVAEYQGKLGTTEFGNLLVEYGVKYNDALLVIENNSIGWATIQAVLNRNYNNLFYSINNMKYVNPHVLDKNTGKLVPGLNTSTALRPLMIAKMEEYYRNKLAIVRSSRLLNQQFTFIWLNNKPQAASGYNDDLVLAQAIGLWIRDTAIKMRTQGIELSKNIINNIKVVNNDNISLNSDFDKNNNPYIMQVADKQIEDLRNWL